MSPELASSNQCSAVSQPKLEFLFELTPDLGRKLNRVATILSRRYEKRVTLEDTLEAMSELFLERLDPERKTQREIDKARARLASMKRSKETSKPAAVERPAVPSQLKIEVLRRDRNQCTFIGSSGARCARKKHINVYPRTLRVRGAGDLHTLCSQHAR